MRVTAERWDGLACAGNFGRVRCDAMTWKFG